MARVSRRASAVDKNRADAEQIAEQVGSNSREAVVSDVSINAVRCAIYARLSVEDDARMESLENQIEISRRFIADREDLFLVDTYFDNGYSGTTFNRPSFNRMIKDLQAGKFRCVVVKDLSRFGRNYLEAGYYIENIFPFLGARLIAVTDNFDSDRASDMGSIMLPVKNMINAMYSKDLSQKVWGTLQKKKAEGTEHGNNYVYGYIYNHNLERFEVDPGSAPYVQMIFQWKLLGISVSKICERLQLIGAPSPRKRMYDLGLAKKESNGHWNQSTVLNMLRSATYVGDTVTNKTSTRIFANQEKIMLDESEWIVNKFTHEAIIARDDYEIIQEELREFTRKRNESLQATKEINEKYPDELKHKVYCGECGRMMRFDRSPHGIKKGVKKVCSYGCRCSSDASAGHKLPEKLLKVLVMDGIHDFVTKICDKAKVYENLSDLKDTDNPISKMDSEIISLNSEMSEIDRRRAKTYEDLSEGIIDSGEFRLLSNAFNNQKAQLSAALEAALEKKKRLSEEMEKALSSVETLGAYLDIRGFDKALVDELVEKITVYKDRHIDIDFKFKDPFESEVKEVC